jgi:hypothetical protein
MTDDRPRSILDGVDPIIAQWLGIASNPRYGNALYGSRQALIDLSENNGRHVERPLPATALDHLISKLLARIEENYAAMGCRQPETSNWVWRKSLHINPNHTAEETSLEKTLVQVLDDTWGNQISVCNGMAERRERSRRIDLVHEINEQEFDFIELKYGVETQGYGADTPLFAAMEILQYALLYLFSREKGLYRIQSENRKLLSAQTIHLIVLAPAGYYTYKLSSGGRNYYDLAWLEACLNVGLCQYLQSRQGSLPVMDFRFQRLLPEFDHVYRPLKAAIDEFRKTGISLRKELCS